jgi:hypothetical protein
VAVGQNERLRESFYGLKSSPLAVRLTSREEATGIFVLRVVSAGRASLGLGGLL